jgi:hypothetical protein
LYIADHSNNRVVVISEKDGKFVGSFEVSKPQHVEVDSSTGEIYITHRAGGGLQLVKFSGWKNPQELAKLTIRGEGDPTMPWGMNLDSGATPLIVWMGGDKGSLLRITQVDGNFQAKNLNSGRYGDLGFVGIEVDHFRRDKEIYVRKNWNGNWLRFSEATEQFETVSCPGTAGSAGTRIVPGTGGKLYAPALPYHLRRYHRRGKPLPWPGGKESYPASTLTSRGKTETPAPGFTGVSPDASVNPPFKLLWTYRMDGDASGDAGAGVTVGGGLVYVNVLDTRSLLALDADTGRLQWE